MTNLDTSNIAAQLHIVASFLSLWEEDGWKKKVDENEDYRILRRRQE